MAYTAIYDAAIQKSWAIPVDFRWAKAQLIAESDLNPDAVSPAGAQGIAQFMPDTWADVTQQLDMVGADVFNPRYAIIGYCHYMLQLWQQWTAPRPELDRLQLTFASYNAGTGNILQAQRWAQMKTGYLDIVKNLAAITGVANAKQTTDYVTRIGAIYLSLTDVTLPPP